jgi:ribosomal protein L2
LKKKVASNYISYKKFGRLQVGKLSKSGRNFSGKIVVNHRGSGNLKNLALIDFTRK